MYRCPVPRQYRWTTSSQVTFRSYVGGKPCLCQNYASTAHPSAVLVRYQAGCKQGAMAVLESWYRVEGWRGTGIAAPVLRPSVG